MLPSIKTVNQSGVSNTDIYSDEFERRRIYITGKIDESMASDICAQINCLAAQGKEDICLVIQSPGGSVSAGYAILDTMFTCGCDIITVAMGEACSMGAVLASSGTKGKRYIGKNADMMIHQVLSGASGQASDLLRTVSYIQKVNKKLHTLLSENTGQDYEKICADCDRDFHLDSQEAIEYGLADHIFQGFDSLSE